MFASDCRSSRPGYVGDLRMFASNEVGESGGAARQSATGCAPYNGRQA